MNAGTIPMSPGVWVSQVVALPSVSANFAVSFRHGLGSRNLRTSWKMVCLRAQSTYLPGDKVDLISGNQMGNWTINTWDNAQEVGMNVYYAGSPTLVSKASAQPAIVLADWGIQVIVEAVSA